MAEKTQRQVDREKCINKYNIIICPYCKSPEIARVSFTNGHPVRIDGVAITSCHHCESCHKVFQNYGETIDMRRLRYEYEIMGQVIAVHDADTKQGDMVDAHQIACKTFSGKGKKGVAVCADCGWSAVYSTGECKGQSHCMYYGKPCKKAVKKCDGPRSLRERRSQ